MTPALHDAPTANPGLDDLLAGTRNETILLKHLNDLTDWHRARCPAYGRLIDVIYPGFRQARTITEVPYLPVGLFKTHRLASVPEEEISVVLTSSGTTGRQPSRIYLDRETARRQSAALAHTMSRLLGPQRLPMIVIDSKGVLTDPDHFSARGAGVMGMMNFGRRHFFALDDHMNLDLEGLSAFLGENCSRSFLIFGFTFMVWQYFYRRIEGAGIDLSNGILVHSGGWKKLQEQSVGNAEFKRRLHSSTGLSRIHNFYGMVEQVGGVFLEGSDGFLHPSVFSDVIVRNPLNWQEATPGSVGVIQVLSSLPLSYPGHSILTEDLGFIVPADGAGDREKSLVVTGRVPSSELRGCSDTHAYSAAAAS